MNLYSLINQMYQHFLAQFVDARVILFHPESRYRSVLLAKILNSSDILSFYYALGPDDIDLQAFLYSITHDIAKQHATFGRHLNVLPQSVYDDLETNFDLLVNTFIKDLSELSQTPFFLILDEYDRSDTADLIQHFIEQIANNLPPQCRVIINGRTLPRLPWVAMIARKDAVLLKDSHLVTRDFYDVEVPSPNHIEVYALGPGFVLLEGIPVDEWEGHLPRLLFFFSLDRPVVTRSEICQAFWPELDADQAVNVFHVTKRRLHKALDGDVLVHEDGYYYVNPEMPRYYDVTDFVTALITGRITTTNAEARIAAWQRAIDLYRGPFLHGHDDTWILRRRHDFCAGYLEALSFMANVWVQRGKREHALSLLQKGLHENYRREDLHREIMKLFNTLGRRSEAAAHYQQLAAILKTEGKYPAPETQQLYADLMA